MIKSTANHGRRRGLGFALFVILCLGMAKVLLPAGPEPSRLPAAMLAERSPADVAYARSAWTMLIIAVCAITSVVAWIIPGLVHIGGADTDHHLLLRTVLGFVFMVAIISSVDRRNLLTDRYWTTWWDPSLVEPDGEIGWRDVLEVTIGSLEGDALTRPQVFRRRAFRRSFAVLVCSACAALAAIAVVIERLYTWRLPAIIYAEDRDYGGLIKAITSASNNLTAYLALLAAGVSIVFTFRQLRAKVRADNRQKWINEARQLIAELVNDADPSAPSKRSVKKRIKLELMLNPKEKDHRLLIYLIQRLARVPNLEHISGAQNLRAVVETELRDLPVTASMRLGRVLDEDDHGTLVGYIVRLSHVLLKREWERVKQAR